MVKELNFNRVSPTAQRLRSLFERRIVGQDDAVTALVECVERFKTGLCDPERPIGSLLFLGPTGTGKTAICEAFCEGLFDNPRACIKIDCAEYQHGHEIAKLIGSPPGYLGHRETPAIFTQKRMTDFYNETYKFTVVLFDEIEKASDTLWHLLLGVLDKGVMTLGDNTVTDFSHSIIVMTSNVGSQEMAKYIGDGSLGFMAPVIDSEKDYAEITEISLNAAKKKFTPEFINRLDHIVTFHTLTKENIEQIVDLELERIQQRFIQSCRLIGLVLSPATKRHLIDVGFDRKYGARFLRRIMEKDVLNPLCQALGTGELQSGTQIVIDYKDGYHFYKTTLNIHDQAAQTSIR